MHLNCELLFREYALPHMRGARVLEIGPDARPSTFERISHAAAWETVDLAAAALGGTPVDHTMPDEYTLPVANGAFDVVLAANVLEHVRRPWVWMVELARVADLVVTISPVSWPYHKAPVDCWRVYPDGMRALCEDAGLDVVLIEWGSLEPARSRHTYPGTGIKYGISCKARIAGFIGWPLPKAYDMITIARHAIVPA